METQLSGEPSPDHKALLRAVVGSSEAYPQERFSGDGIVICGGGVRYFTCAWVCIRMLRKLGCQLPIELWHLGPLEMDDRMRELITPYGVKTVDAEEVRKTHPARILNGWELKPYSIIHSSFERVILLDADLVPLIDPAIIFSWKEFVESGAIFWPDYCRLEPFRAIWEACEVTYRDEPEFESGQVVVDKRRCWRALQVAMYMNEYSDYYYDMIHGDKETFHLAFLCTETPYRMPSRGIDSLEGTMCQHDFAGFRIFQHRNMAKWDLFGENPRVDGFIFEEECFAYLEELLHQWGGHKATIPRFESAGKTPREIEAAVALTSRVQRYVRIGHDERLMTFLPTGRIGYGRMDCEVFWNIREVDGGLVLTISGTDALTCELQPTKNGGWLGEWAIHEKMPVAVVPTDHVPDSDGPPKLEIKPAFVPGRRRARREKANPV